MRDVHITTDIVGNGIVRKLTRQEMPLLREHLLRLDPESRRDRFNGYADEDFIRHYAEHCADNGATVIAYIEHGIVTAAAELHTPYEGGDPLPEVAFSVERHLRRQGVGSTLFERLIEEARRKGYRSLRITTGAQNEAMRALAHKFGAHLTFLHGESSGTLDLRDAPVAPAQPNIWLSGAQVMATISRFQQEWWRLAMEMYGFERRHA